jgi:hypothetical protein
MKHHIKNNIQQQESQPGLHYMRGDNVSKLLSNSKQWLCRADAENGHKISLILNDSSPSATEQRAMILSRVSVTKTGFRPVIGLINHLQGVTTIDNHTVPDFHITNHLCTRTLGFPVFTSRLLATNLNIETVTVSVDYTLQVLHIHETS